MDPILPQFFIIVAAFLSCYGVSWRCSPVLEFKTITLGNLATYPQP